jgi:uncharacterized membrane protein
MGKSFYLSILAWFGGTTLCIILSAIVFKIGWESKERVLLWGFGGLCSITVFVFTFAKQINATQVKELEDKIAKKAELSDIKNMQIQIDDSYKVMTMIQQSQEETRTIIENIYERLLTMKN